MSAFRNIETRSYAKIDPPSSLGRPPKLEWLAIRQLFVDTEYQREITNQGRSNVRRIAEQFNWSMFGAVVVAGVGSDQYAIVDGQHRVTAAALCGVDKVPCQIIEAIRGEQAAAFRAINGNTTRLHALQLFHAAVAAGDPACRKVADVCQKAGVTIVRNPTMASLLKRGQTMVSGTITKAIARFGVKTTILGLKMLVESGEGNPGLLNRTIVWATIEVLSDHPEWCIDPIALKAAFDGFDLEEFSRDAAAIAARMRGTSATDQFEARLVAALASALDRKRGATA